MFSILTGIDLTIHNATLSSQQFIVTSNSNMLKTFHEKDPGREGWETLENPVKVTDDDQVDNKQELFNTIC